MNIDAATGFVLNFWIESLKSQLELIQRCRHRIYDLSMCRGYKALSILPTPRLEGMEDFCQLEASKLTEVQQSRSLGLKKKQTTEANLRSFEKLHRKVPSKLRWIYNFIDCFIVFCWLCFIVLYLEKTHAQFLQQIHTRWQRKATKSQACLVE